MNTTDEPLLILCPACDGQPRYETICLPIRRRFMVVCSVCHCTPMDEYTDRSSANQQWNAWAYWARQKHEAKLRFEQVDAARRSGIEMCEEFRKLLEAQAKAK